MLLKSLGKINLRRDLLVNLFALFSLCIFVSGCVTFTPYRGDKITTRIIEAPAPAVFQATLEDALEQSIVFLGSQERLGIVQLRFDFPNAQTPGSATTAVSPFAEPAAQAINPYGQNPYVRVTVRVKRISADQTELRIVSRFETFGDPRGVGGAGPFQMNSKGVWEEQYADRIAALASHSATAAAQPGQPVGTGTGFFITSSGHILTNDHVAGECSTVSVEFPGEGSIAAATVARDQQNDLAIVKAEYAPEHWAPFRSGPPIRAGDNVTSFGFPLSRALASQGNVVTGNITALAGFQDDTRFYQISAPIQPGNSGGPLFDEHGNVVGVTTSSLVTLSAVRATGTIPQNVNFAIKSSLAEAFAASHGISLESSGPGAAMTAADIAASARRFTVRLTCIS